MKIYGYEAESVFTTYHQEPGAIYGHNDVLTGERVQVHRTTYSFWRTSSETITRQPKLYLHFSQTFCSKVTGLLRECCLPWKWKVAYLDRENGTPLERILVCTDVYDVEMPDELNQVLGNPPLIVNLINSGRYQEIFNREYLQVPRENGRQEIRINHPLGALVGQHLEPNSPNQLCHIYRIRGIFSRVIYHLLKTFSSTWEEVALRSGQFSEKILVKQEDRALLTRAGLIVSQ